MKTVLLDQTRIFLWSCALGGVLGLLWDLLRGARAAFRLKRRGTAVLDGFFCLLSTAVLLLFLLQRTDGALRTYITAGGLLGFLLWRLTASHPLAAAFTAFWRAVRRASCAAGRGMIWAFTPPRGN